LQAESLRDFGIRSWPGLCEHDRRRLNRDHSGGRIGPARFDDRKRFSRRQRLDKIGRRLFGDNDQRTL
jgi:hypothetical protein